ncbi:MAG: ribose-phosphate pyrophosphokinase, partial [Acholeplasmataceae bacterium]|nr:ribose-phosphate pyrophosphokinase [Acholeplasmataceae bacterium]
MIIDGKKVQLFALSANVELAKEISEYSGIPISKCEINKFADDEIGLNIEQSVRGNHIFVVQPTNNPVNEHLMELLIMIDALKRASATSVTILMPYFGYSRQDRKAKSRQPITAKLVADLIQTAGANRVICIDLHAAQVQGFFDIPIDNFPAAPLLASYFNKRYLDDLIVVSPDHGGVTRARSFARLFDVPIAIIDKRRPAPNQAEVINVIGDVTDKTCILFDDIIDTGGTLIAGAEALLKRGAKKVLAAATHAVFSRGAMEKLEASKISKIVITNTLYPEKIKESKKFVVLSISQL